MQTQRCAEGAPTWWLGFPVPSGRKTPPPSCVLVGSPACIARPGGYSIAHPLYGEIVGRLGDVPRFHKAALIPQVTSLLAGEVAERGRRVVLVLDEAHFLSRSQLEELRLLTNAEMDSTSPFHSCYSASPALRLCLGTFAALDQRITLRYAIPPMSAEECSSYVPHHPRLARRNHPLQRRHRPHPPNEECHDNTRTDVGAVEATGDNPISAGGQGRRSTPSSPWPVTLAGGQHSGPPCAGPSAWLTGPRSSRPSSRPRSGLA